ncbi:histidinol-phosphatase [Alkalitalea saponilacus]|uniref:Histidinol-phosphatase n=1 Tax=Alkalitalea saponilacus TaxID=889453 RepID=A0A1T5D2H0_9BACT|nr:histidinol-phosphatase [Alkalitalea saponilacus]ASB50554.1 histidinol phosphatase [Alkalitalea saponilacus]SKB65905.1 histidinol-phosphatase (PHP family) [Alkalitalea saponilacus]
MSWSNYHGHSFYCDGRKAPEEYIPAALEQGMKIIGFSCHAPVPFETGWTMPKDKLPQYLLDIEQLQSKNFNGLLVLKSLEVDYIPDIAGPLHPDILSAKLDYVVGSIHYVDQFPSGQHWSIDNSNEEFEQGIAEVFNGNVKSAVTRYFHLQMEMLRYQPPSIIGHMDKIRMHNVVKQHFNEDDDWYVELVRETMLMAKDKNVIVEINTKYFAKNGLLFPDHKHFKWMFENDIPVTINSDAHDPEKLTSGFSQVAKLLMEAGYTRLMEWKDGKFIPMPFNEKGIKWE